MRIDPGYFNHFMFIVAITCIIVIALASFRYLAKQEERFQSRLEQISLSDFVFLDLHGDSLRVAEVDQPVVLLYWSTWSDRSVDSLNDLYKWHEDNPHFKVIAAYVKDSPDFVLDYNREQVEYFRLLDGTPSYQDYRVPGVPTVIVFDEYGNFKLTETGSQSVPVWHDLAIRLELNQRPGLNQYPELNQRPELKQNMEAVE